MTTWKEAYEMYKQEVRDFRETKARDAIERGLYSSAYNEGKLTGINLCRNHLDNVRNEAHYEET